ncbi:MAG: formylglycine-generating enzyme family protein [Treponema sp.]|nr:formylglycine-generating enzyme family protein [Treponema sp.]
MAWHWENSGRSTQPVGTKQPNRLGLYDMSGNVWERCGDLYGSYSSGIQTDPTAASSGTCRVGRGGGWSNSTASMRAATRYYGLPSNRYSNFGFRLVRTLV